MTWYPFLASSPAQVSPAGPEPTTATFLPLDSGLWGAALTFSRYQSAANRSSRPMATGSPLMPRTHFASHWVSWGQTRPDTAGRALSAAMTS